MGRAANRKKIGKRNGNEGNLEDRNIKAEGERAG